MKKKDKKEDKNLVWIDTPIVDDKGNTNALIVGMNTWEMYNSDFNLTINEICSILECERKWVVNYVKDNVKHIFLNEKFRIFLHSLDAQNKLNTFNPETFLKDYYYFSRKDFNKWIKTNTKITRQTIKINIEDYSDFPDKIEKFNKEYEKMSSTLKGAKEAELLYRAKIYSILNDAGRNMLDNEAIVTKRKAAVVDVTAKEEIPLTFISIKNLKGDRSLELAYRSLYKHGALKYTIMDSLVRYDDDYVNKGHIEGNNNIITILYDIYLKNKKYAKNNNKY